VRIIVDIFVVGVVVAIVTMCSQSVSWWVSCPMQKPVTISNCISSKFRQFLGVSVSKGQIAI